MPKVPLHALIWSQDHSRYDLYTQGGLSQYFRLEDRDAWLMWLHDAASFAFQGVSGRLNVYLEERLRGGHYWYAYHTVDHRTRKRYLGRTASVTFALLEEVAKALGSESSPTPHAPERSPDERDAASPGEVFYGMEVLSIKLSHPRLPFRLLARERLLHRLDQACFHRLTLLSASAGWGKTTLLSTWAFRSTLPIAWLSLDELDNDPTRFWVSVLVALRTCLPGVGETALSMLRSPQRPSLTICLSTILNDLYAQDVPTVLLLLDDYHLIDEQAIHDSLLFVLDHLPAHLHLVLSSRVDPPLTLSRWRARGQLLELRDADLHFQEEEAAQFLTHTMDLSLEAEEIAELARRTEGWIAGLQLAALSLQQREDRSAFVREFTGGHRYVQDYVQEEILAHLQAPLRDFLLHTCILIRLSASLCQAVTAQSDIQVSSELLRQVERANLFLVPLDEERRWYRFHDLFREALLACLHASQPELIPLLHRRAASFYEAQGEYREAIAHALEAGDFSYAVRLMEQTAEHFWLLGEVATMSCWVMELPDAVVHEHASLVLTVALYLIGETAPTVDGQHTRAHQEAQYLMARVEMALQHQENRTRPSTNVTLPEAGFVLGEKDLAAEEALPRQRLYLLHAWCAFREAQARGDYEQMSIIDQEMQQIEREDEPIWQLIPLGISLIFRCTVRREGALLVPGFLDAKQRFSRLGQRFVLFKIMHALALALVDAGQLRLTYQECLSGLDLLKQSAGSAQVAWHFSVSLVIVLYQWNRLEEAGSVLRTMIHDAAIWQQSDVQAWGYHSLLMVELAAGNLAAARQTLQEGEHLAQRQAGAVQSSWLTEMRVRWWLAQGNVSKASDWAAQVVLPQNGWAPDTYEACLLLIRLLLAQQQWMQAVEILERWSLHLDRPGNRFMSISFLSLYVVALHQAGKREQGCTVAVRLLTETEPDGYLRVYLDTGEPMKQVLQSFLEASPDDNQPGAVSRSYVMALLAAFEQEEAQCLRRAEIQPIEMQEVLALPSSHTPRVSPDSDPASPCVPVHVEPLSCRELSVLRRLCTGRSNREIASELMISINTVKGHIKKIYSKLQVSKRIEACEVARALRLFLEKPFRPAGLVEPPSSTTRLGGTS